LIESFARKVTFPVRIFKNERNLGSTRNFEKAIGNCDGDLIALSDQDDEWYPDKLARMHRLFEELPEALAAFSNADIIDDDSAFAGRKLWRSIGVDFRPEREFRMFIPESCPLCSSWITLQLARQWFSDRNFATSLFRFQARGHTMPGSHGSQLCEMGWQHFQQRRFAIVSMHGSRLELPPPSLVDKLAIAQKDAVIFRLIASRLKDLQLYLQQHRDDEQLAKFIPDLNAKIQHLEGRASLTGSVLRRVLWVLQSWREYQRYARGPKAMVIDAFIVSGNRSGGKGGE